MPCLLTQGGVLGFGLSSTTSSLSERFYVHKELHYRFIYCKHLTRCAKIAEGLANVTVRERD